MEVTADPRAAEDTFTSLMVRRPPGKVFHLVLAVPVVLLLWADSLPGFGYALAVAGVLIGAALATVWLARVFATLAVRTRRGLGWPGRQYLFMPVAIAALFTLMSTDASLKARWALSKGAFDRTIRGAPLRGEPHFEIPSHIGLYRITSAIRVGDAHLFYEETGALFDYAGFAYLPGGKDPGLSSVMEGPTSLRPLGDDWYVFTASW